jgi:hypothetical protein
MTPEEFHREYLYQITMSIARSMLKKGIISGAEFRKLEQEMLAKYKSPNGCLEAKSA